MLLLTAADRADDLDSITIGEFDSHKLAARNNLAVTFNRDAFALQAEFANQVRYLDRGLEPARFSIDAEADHFALLVQSFICSELLDKNAITLPHVVAKRVHGEPAHDSAGKDNGNQSKDSQQPGSIALAFVKLADSAESGLDQSGLAF